MIVNTTSESNGCQWRFLNYMFKWQKGRQEGSYSKLPFFISTLFNCDFYLLRFPAGCSVMRHKDPVKVGYSHHRINIIVGSCSTRDRMYIDGPIWRWRNIEYFRPDLYEHGLAPIENKMYMLSFGWRKKSS